MIFLNGLFISYYMYFLDTVMIGAIFVNQHEKVILQKFSYKNNNQEGKLG